MFVRNMCITWGPYVHTCKNVPACEWVFFIMCVCFYVGSSASCFFCFYFPFSISCRRLDKSGREMTKHRRIQLRTLLHHPAAPTQTRAPTQSLVHCLDQMAVEKRNVLYVLVRDRNLVGCVVSVRGLEKQYMSVVQQPDLAVQLQAKLTFA